MARRLIERLSARAVMTLTLPGRHADGGNLYLSIGKNGSRKWSFLYRERGTGRLREMGLGPAPGPRKAGLPLRDARSKATDARRLIYNGIDPLADKRAKTIASATMTFGELSDQLIDAISPGFKSAVHIAQWKSTLKEYAAPLRPMAIRKIDTEDVLCVLKPIWDTKHETASRLRGRIERILDAASAKGLRSGDNPARWRGHLKELLSKRKKLQRGHHGALKYQDMPEFMHKLRERKSISALALEFTILVAGRTGEVISARFNEFDLAQRVWTVPPERMKAGREHRVPLCDRAMEIMKSLAVDGIQMKPDAFVFPGRKKNTPLSNMAMLELLRDIQGKGATVHGFRSTFKDWASESTMHENMVTEMALAHTIGSDVEAAYRRGDLFTKRKALMDDWQKFVSDEMGNVLPMARKSAH